MSYKKIIIHFHNFFLCTMKEILDACISWWILDKVDCYRFFTQKVRSIIPHGLWLTTPTNCGSEARICALRAVAGYDLANGVLFPHLLCFLSLSISQIYCVGFNPLEHSPPISPHLDISAFFNQQIIKWKSFSHFYIQDCTVKFWVVIE